MVQICEGFEEQTTQESEQGTWRAGFAARTVEHLTLRLLCAAWTYTRVYCLLHVDDGLKAWDGIGEDSDPGVDATQSLFHFFFFLLTIHFWVFAIGDSHRSILRTLSCRQRTNTKVHDCSIGSGQNPRSLCQCNWESRCVCRSFLCISVWILLYVITSTK